MALLAVVCTALASGCSQSEVLVPRPAEAQAPATIAELVGPWRERPLRLDPAMRVDAERACRRDMGLSVAANALVVDARGGSVVGVLLAGRGGEGGGCDGLQVLPNGTLVGASGGWGGIGNFGVAEGALRIMGTSAVGGGDLDVTGWTVYGQVGPGIVSVMIETPGRPIIVATLENGLFRAWWPRFAGEPDPLFGGEAAEVRVVGLDAGGRPVAEAKADR